MSAAVYQMKQAKKSHIRRKVILHISKAVFWFAAGALFATFLLTSFTIIFYEKANYGLVYPGITINNIKVERRTFKEVEELFIKRNEAVGDTQFIFSLNDNTIVTSAKDLKFGYNQDLIAKQAISLGRSDDLLSNISLILQAYFNGLNLQPSYRYSEDVLNKTLTPFVEKEGKEPVDALFTFQEGRVLTFKPSEEGKAVDVEKVKKDLASQLEKVLLKQKPQKIVIPVSIKTLQPKITTDKANNLGIKELIGTGTSFFQHSIQSRIFNINLAASRINGALIGPNETFSFNKALGDVSSFTGYQQAYIIQNGKTVLGDGGGVCQVSTTLFRALLNSGLPILERYAHAYRVGYYEQDSPPGFDATVYSPSVDLKFKNDTGNHILIQTYINPDMQELTFSLYGTKDGRAVNISQPVIANRIPPPPDLYQDDPTLSKGIIKQVDFKAEGARVSFTRDVMRNGKKIISENFISNYAPWQSIFLRGTKE